jgi:Protein of function (DUF2518)
MAMQINFYTLSQWFAILTLVCLGATFIGFVLKWGFRFRLVGVTGFMGVLTFGLFALGLGLYTPTKILGSVRYTLVYDNGANLTVIAVAPQVNQEEVEATLRKAAKDLYSPGRIGVGNNVFTVRLRTVIHPEEGVSEPLYLGQVGRSLVGGENEKIEVEVFSENFAKLPAATPSEAEISLR